MFENLQLFSLFKTSNFKDPQLYYSMILLNLFINFIAIINLIAIFEIVDLINPINYYFFFSEEYFFI